MADDSLRIALLVYRGNPHSGGQGVYTRYLSRELVALGHRVTVFAGQPWPVLDDGVGWVPVPSLDLYRQPDPFRIPRPTEFRSPIDLVEFGTMCGAGFPEPRTFSWRVRRSPRRPTAGAVRRRPRQPDVRAEPARGHGRRLAAARDVPPSDHRRPHPRAGPCPGHRGRSAVACGGGTGSSPCRSGSPAHVPRILTVSESSKRDIVEQMRHAGRPAWPSCPSASTTSASRPRDDIVARVPGRIMTTASLADVPLKGLVPLLEAVAKLRVERPETHLVVVGRLREDGAGRHGASSDLDLGRCSHVHPGRHRRPADRDVR